MATEASLDGHGGERRVKFQGTCWNLQPQTMALPLICASFPCSQCQCGPGHYVSSSDGGWRGIGRKREFTKIHSLTIQDLATTMSIKTQITVLYTTIYLPNTFSGLLCLSSVSLLSFSSPAFPPRLPSYSEDSKYHRAGITW